MYQGHTLHVLERVSLTRPTLYFRRMSRKLLGHRLLYVMSRRSDLRLRTAYSEFPLPAVEQADFSLKITFMVLRSQIEECVCSWEEFFLGLRVHEWFLLLFWYRPPAREMMFSIRNERLGCKVFWLGVRWFDLPSLNAEHVWKHLNSRRLSTLCLQIYWGCVYALSGKDFALFHAR